MSGGKSVDCAIFLTGWEESDTVAFGALAITGKQAIVLILAIRPLLAKQSGRFCLVVAIALSVFIMLPFPRVFGAEPLFTIKSYEFCRDVVDNAPLQPYENPTQIRKREKLWIWLELSVTQQGRRFLTNLGKFPVYVIWGKDDWLIGKATDVGITPEQWEANERGILWKSKNSSDSTFTWRTHAVREILSPGEYYVSILDANRKSVTTLDDTATPCRPEMQLIDVEK
jgi:hypothetical protein